MIFLRWSGLLQIIRLSLIHISQMLYDQGQADFAALLAAKQAVEDAQTAYDTAVETTNRAIKTCLLYTSSLTREMMSVFQKNFTSEKTS